MSASHGVFGAGAARNGVASTLAVVASQPAVFGPVAQPHQSFSAWPSPLADAALKSFTPKGLLSPRKLLPWICWPAVVLGAPSSSTRTAPNGVTVQPPNGQGEK